MKTYITRTSQVFYSPAVGLLLLRVSTGLIFFLHGIMKVGAMDRTVGMFSGMGFPVFVAYFIAYLEVIGGLGLIIGIGTRMFGFLFGIEMLVATIIVGFNRGLGLEFYLAAISFAVALLGSGRFALIRSRHSLDGVVTQVEETVQVA